MLLKTDLPLEAASTIVDRALAAGREAGMAPLTVAVLDAGGHLIALKRADGSGILRPEIAIGKAWGALGMGESSAGRWARACATHRRSRTRSRPHPAGASSPPRAAS